MSTPRVGRTRVRWVPPSSIVTAAPTSTLPLAAANQPTTTDNQTTEANGTTHSSNISSVLHNVYTHPPPPPSSSSSVLVSNELSPFHSSASTPPVTHREGESITLIPTHTISPTTPPTSSSTTQPCLNFQPTIGHDRESDASVSTPHQTRRTRASANSVASAGASRTGGEQKDEPEKEKVIELAAIKFHLPPTQTISPTLTPSPPSPPAAAADPPAAVTSTPPPPLTPQPAPAISIALPVSPVSPTCGVASPASSSPLPSPSSPSCPSTPLPSYDDIPLLPNGRPNKALISARQAFLAKNQRSTPSLSTLIPGINDSPPRTPARTPSLATPRGSPQPRPSPSSSPSNDRARSTSVLERGSSFFNGTRPSSPPIPLARSASTHTIRHIPNDDDSNRDGTGGTSSSVVGNGSTTSPVVVDDEPPFQSIRKLHPSSHRADSQHRSRRTNGRHRRLNWNWPAIKLSLMKDRPSLPVIGGKYSFRSTFHYIPYGPEFYQLHRRLHSIMFQCVMTFLILVTIFGTDFTFAFLPTSCDGTTSLLLFIILILQSCECLLNWLLHSNYGLSSIYFYFDIISILSLIVDIDSIDPSSSSSSSSSSGLNTGWSMGLGENSFYTLSLRDGSHNFLSQFSCFLKTLRILKLIRVWNLLTRMYVKKRYENLEAMRCLGQQQQSSKHMMNEEYDSEGLPNSNHHTLPSSVGANHAIGADSSLNQSVRPPPSQLGTILHDIISIRIGVCIVFIGCILPILWTNMFTIVSNDASRATWNGLQHVTTTYVSQAMSGGNMPVNELNNTNDISIVPFNSLQLVTMPLLYDAFLATYDDDKLVRLTTSLTTRTATTTTTTTTTPTGSSSSSGDSSLRTYETMLKNLDPSLDLSNKNRRYGLELREYVVASNEFSWTQSSNNGGVSTPIFVTFTIHAIFDTHSELQRSSWLHLLFQFILIFTFLFLTSHLHSNISHCMIQPFEHIVQNVWSLTKMIGIVKDENLYRRKYYGAIETEEAGAAGSGVGGRGAGGAGGDVGIGSMRQQNGSDQAGMRFHTRMYKSIKHAFTPSTVRAYEIRIIDDLISKLGRIFHVQPSPRTAILGVTSTSTSTNPIGIGLPAVSGMVGTSSKKVGIGSDGLTTSNKLNVVNNVTNNNNPNNTPTPLSLSHLSKSMRLLTGTRLTEIQTPTTILTVQVSERPLEQELKGFKGTLTPSGQKIRVRNYGDDSKRRTSISSHVDRQGGGEFEREYSTRNGRNGNKNSQVGGNGSGVGGEHSLSRSQCGSIPGQHATILVNSPPPPAASRHDSPHHSHAFATASKESAIVAAGHRLGLTSSLMTPKSPASSSTSNRSSKAAMLLGLSSTKRRTGDVHEILIKEGHIDVRDHPELGNLDALLVQPLALTHFRAFLQSKRSLEILLFYIQVLKYQQDLLQRSSWIYHHFVRIGSSHEINLPAEIRLKMFGDLSQPSFELFERAKLEVVNLLRGSFQEFLGSEATLNYLANKMRQRIVLKTTDKIVQECQT